MTAPQLVKSWTVSPNVRLTPYVSLNLTMGWWLYQNKAAASATHWPTDYSCDGVTGPTNGTDHTDRWATSASCLVRATVDAAAQSWWIGKNSEGVQILLDYQGATDDVARVSFSPSGLYTLAGTTTNRPTATDEVILSGATTIIGTGTSLDRVMQIMVCATGWRCVVFRSNAVQSGLMIGKTTSLAKASAFPIPYVGGNHNVYSRDVATGSTWSPCEGAIPNTALGAAGFRSFAALVHTAGADRTCRMGGMPMWGSMSKTTNPGTSNFTLNVVGNNTNPGSTDGTASPTLPIILVGELTANLDGIWAYLIDWWQMITTSVTVPAAADMVPGFDPADVPGVSGGQTGVGDARTNWCVALGAGAIWPWRNAAASMETT